MAFLNDNMASKVETSSILRASRLKSAISELKPKDKTHCALMLLKKITTKIGDPKDFDDKDTDHVMEILKILIDEHL